MDFETRNYLRQLDTLNRPPDGYEPSSTKLQFSPTFREKLQEINVGRQQVNPPTIAPAKCHHRFHFRLEAFRKGLTPIHRRLFPTTSSPFKNVLSRIDSSLHTDTPIKTHRHKFLSLLLCLQVGLFIAEIESGGFFERSLLF